MTYLHLDSEYRRRWIEFYLANGTIENSKEKNWRQIQWDKVVKLIVYMEGKKYEVKISHASHKFFLNFRWGGREKINNEFKQINIWTVGWSDGERAFLIDIDFFTGNLVKKYVAPLYQFKQHIHPSVLKYVNYQVK